MTYKKTLGKVTSVLFKSSVNKRQIPPINEHL